MTFQKGNKANPNGRPKGVGNRIPKHLQELIVMAGQINGHPQRVMEQARDDRGRRLYVMHTKGRHKGKPVLENGKPIPLLRAVTAWTGDMGLLGYLVWLGKELPKEYVSLLRGVTPHNVRVALVDGDTVDDDDIQGTANDLRRELESRGLPADYVLSELAKEINPKGKPPARQVERTQHQRPKLIDHDLRRPTTRTPPATDPDDADDFGDEDRWR